MSLSSISQIKILKTGNLKGSLKQMRLWDCFPSCTRWKFTTKIFQQYKRKKKVMCPNIKHVWFYCNINIGKHCCFLWGQPYKESSLATLESGKQQIHSIMNLLKTVWRVVKKKSKTYTRAYSPTASKNCNFCNRDIVRFWLLKCVWAEPSNIFYAWDQMSIVIYRQQKEFNPLAPSRRFGLKQDITSSILGSFFFKSFSFDHTDEICCVWPHIKHNGNRVSQSLKVMLLFAAVKVFKITINQQI